MKQSFHIIITVILLLSLAGGLKACKFIKEYTYDYSDSDFVNSIEEHDVERVKKYLKRGFNANSNSSEGRPLITYANPDLVDGREIISLFLDHGADINSKYILTTKDYLGNITGTYDSSLLYHAAEGNQDAIKFLLENNANPNITINPDNKTPLMIAARKGEQNVVQMLLDSGADPNMVDINGCSALNFAYFSKDTVTEESLLNAGAKKVVGYCEF